MLNERFSDRRQRLLRLKVMREGGRLPSSSRIDAPAIFEQCPACGEAVSKRQWADQLYVCPHCGHHRPIGAYQRLALTLDSGTFQELNDGMCAANPLGFEGYDAKLDGLRRRTGLSEAHHT